MLLIDMVQEEYRNEGITWESIEFFNNKVHLHAVCVLPLCPAPLRR